MDAEIEYLVLLTFAGSDRMQSIQSLLGMLVI